MTAFVTERASHRFRLSVITRSIQVIEALTRPFGHRGYWHLLRIVTSLAPHQLACVTLEGKPFYFFLDDPYWARILGSGFCYEQEIHEFLDLLEDTAFDFIDGGANIGYWSKVVTCKFPHTKVVAVEPNEYVFDVLSKNAEGTGIKLHKAALVSDPSAQMTLYVPHNGSWHADASVVRKSNIADLQEIPVDTVSLEEILAGGMQQSQKILLKLDIEGLEVDILASLQRIRDQRVAIIYEEHGSDALHSVTCYLSSIGNYALFFLAPGLSPHPIRKPGDLDYLKRQASRGYNCLAVPVGGSWTSMLAGLVRP